MRGFAPILYSSKSLRKIRAFRTSLNFQFYPMKIWQKPTKFDFFSGRKLARNLEIFALNLRESVKIETASKSTYFSRAIGWVSDGYNSSHYRYFPEK